MLKADQVPQVIWQTGELVFTQIHLDEVSEAAELWLQGEKSRDEERRTSYLMPWKTKRYLFDVNLYIYHLNMTL